MIPKCVCRALALFALFGAIVNVESRSQTVPVADCGGRQSPPSTPPSQAASAGFSYPAFDDEFNSTGTISPDGSGGYKWYTTNFYNAFATLPNSGYRVSNGCLTILTDASGYGEGIATADPSNPSGVFRHGYFEARMRFDPNGWQGGAWPAFWSYSLEGTQGTSPYAELDFMEAYPTPPGATIITTVHQWTTNAYGPSTSVQNPNNVPTLPAGTDLSKFHVYGCLWTPNRITWYLDDRPITTVATGPGTNFTSIEPDHMVVILGTGTNWPIDVDFVHVWQ